MSTHLRALTGAVGAFFAASAAAISSQTALTTEMVASGLSNPVFVTSPPGDCSRLFVVEQQGTIRIVKHGSLLATPFLDLTTPVLSGGEQGLLGLAFHPSYATNGFFYVNYTRKPDGATVVERFRASANPDVANPSSALPLLVIAQPFDNHNGGMLAFGPNDGFLYIGMGDGGSGGDPFNNAQNPDVLLGKMLRIDVDHASPPLAYAIPPSNPFAGAAAGADEIWSVGLRNPWRFTFDRATGDMYIGDVGQNSVEEIDFEPAGSPGGLDYGWRCMEGTSCTGLEDPPRCTCNAPNLVLPVHDYDHSFGCAVIGGYAYRGFAMPGVSGTYFFADDCSDRFWSFQMVGSTKTNFLERTAELGPGPGMFAVSSFGEDANGELYITYLSGEVMKIVPASSAFAGIASFGAGTPGCNGSHALHATCTPKIGNACFELRAQRAPANSIGLGLIADAQSAAGTDPFGLGVTFHVDLLAASAIVSMDLHVNGAGTAVGTVAIPNSPAAVGATFFAQGFFVWGATCSLPPFGLSSTNGLSITLQS